MLRPPTSSSQFFSRNLSLNFFKGWGRKCEKVECAESSEPTPKYVIQKSCCPSIFETWKPKIPDLNAANYPSIKTSMMMPYKQKPCAAGMKFRDKSNCEIQIAAKQCEKMNHPKWVNRCPPRPKHKIDGPLPPLKEAAVKCKGSKGQVEKKPTVKSLRKKCEPQVPNGDWNADGNLSS